MAAVSNPLQGCIKRCTETCRECDRGESNLDSHHERNETDEVLRPCWFAHSLKTDSRSVENNQRRPLRQLVRNFFLHFCLRDSLSMYGSTIGCSVVYIFNINYTVSIKVVICSKFPTFVVESKIKSRKIKIKKCRKWISTKKFKH